MCMNFDEWRKGQLAFNIISMVRPDIAKKLLNTVADPYYNDSNIPAFWAAVSQALKQEREEQGNDENA